MKHTIKLLQDMIKCEKREIKGCQNCIDVATDHPNMFTLDGGISKWKRDIKKSKEKIAEYQTVLTHLKNNKWNS